MTGNAQLRGVSAADFTDYYKYAVECGIFKSVSTSENPVAREAVNINSVTDDVTRRMQNNDMNQQLITRRVTGNCVNIEFVLTLLPEKKMELSPSTRAATIASRLTTAQESGELASEVNHGRRSVVATSIR
jgi:hypothetical protein